MKPCSNPAKAMGAFWRPFHRCPKCGTLTDGLYEKKGQGFVHGRLRCEQTKKAKQARKARKPA